MPTFTTPSPIALSVRFPAGTLRVDAEERDTTTVDVAPENPASTADVEHAAATVVEQRGDEIVVVAPESRGWFGRTPKLRVTVQAPTRSRLTVDVKSGDITTAGELGDTEINSASGDVRVDRVASLDAATASGNIVAEHVDGRAGVRSASGDVRIATVGGDGEFNTASGDIAVTEIGGEVRGRSASGDFSVGSLAGGASVRTASGDVRLRSIRDGSIEIHTASGDVWIGVADGTVAWLECESLSGDVSSDLDAADAPGEDAPRASIHVRTLSGDIAIRRA